MIRSKVRSHQKILDLHAHLQVIDTAELAPALVHSVPIEHTHPVGGKPLRLNKNANAGQFWCQSQENVKIRNISLQILPYLCVSYVREIL